VETNTRSEQIRTLTLPLTENFWVIHWKRLRLPCWCRWRPRYTKVRVVERIEELSPEFPVVPLLIFAFLMNAYPSFAPRLYLGYCVPESPEPQRPIRQSLC